RSRTRLYPVTFRFVPDGSVANPVAEKPPPRTPPRRPSVDGRRPAAVLPRARMVRRPAVAVRKLVAHDDSADMAPVQDDLVFDPNNLAARLVVAAAADRQRQMLGAWALDPNLVHAVDDDDFQLPCVWLVELFRRPKSALWRSGHLRLGRDRARRQNLH